MSLGLSEFVIVFFLFSVLGWCMEVILKMIELHRFVNRGFLIGPYCPIYGFGVVFIIVILQDILHLNTGIFSTFAGGFIGNGKVGENIKSELKLNIYCPYQNGGDGITHTINCIVELLPKADSDNIISSINVSEIKYSQEYEAVYRTLSLSLDYLDYRGE